MCSLLLLEGRGSLPDASGRVTGYVEDLELYPVRVVEKNGVVARHVRVLLRAALDLGAAVAQPLGRIVHVGARRRVEGDVVDPDAVAVVLAFDLCLAQAEVCPRAAEVPDRLA